MTTVQQVFEQLKADWLSQGERRARQEAQKAEASLITKSREEGREEIQRQTILLLLQARLGALPREIDRRVHREDRAQVLERWYHAAVQLTDEPSARRLLSRIRAAKSIAARRARAR